jgi:AraC-like DNA-binding protein
MRGDVSAMAKTEVRYSFASPSLFDSIVAYLEIEISEGGPLEDLLPPDWASIILAVDGTWEQGTDRQSLTPITELSPLYGMKSKANWVRGGPGLAFCIGISPHGWASLFNNNADHYADKIAPLADMLGDDANILLAQARECGGFFERVAMANGFFETRLARHGKKVRAKELALIKAALADPDCATVEEMTERVGLSQSRLLRLTKASYGFSPKFLIRRERFLRMLHKMEARPYAEWRDFIDHQYVDQSHLIRDFNEFMGLSPTRYLALDRPFLNAAMDSLRRMLGIHAGVTVDA